MLISQILYSIDQVTMLKKIQEMYMREKTWFYERWKYEGEDRIFRVRSEHSSYIFIFGFCFYGIICYVIN